MPQYSRSQFSRFLAQWEFADSLDQNGALVVRSGQTPTYARGGTAGAASAIDVNGVVYQPGVNSPCFHHQYDAASGLFKPVGILLEGARKNLVVQSDAITAANGWTVSGGITPTANYSQVGSLGLTRFTGVGAGLGVDRAVTLTGDGVKAFSAVVRFDGVTGTTSHGLYDVTSAAARCVITVTWAADGTAVAVAATGVLLAFFRMGNGAYRIMAQTTTCAAAHAHQVWVVGIFTGSCNAVRVGGVMVEDAAYPSMSIISTTTVTVTQSADGFTLPFNISAAQLAASGVSIYEDFIAGRPSNGDTSAAACSLVIGATAAGTLNSIQIASNALASAPLADSVLMYGGGLLSESDVNVTYAIGDRIERLTTITASGVAIMSITKNSAAAVVGSTGAAGGWPAAFGSPIIALNDTTAAFAGTFARKSVRVAAAVQSLAYMQSA
jgi:hypothetical protein